MDELCHLYQRSKSGTRDPTTNWSTPKSVRYRSRYPRRCGRGQTANKDERVAKATAQDPEVEACFKIGRSKHHDLFDGTSSKWQRQVPWKRILVYWLVRQLPRLKVCLTDYASEYKLAQNISPTFLTTFALTTGNCCDRLGPWKELSMS